MKWHLTFATWPKSFCARQGHVIGFNRILYAKRRKRCGDEWISADRQTLPSDTRRSLSLVCATQHILLSSEIMFAHETSKQPTYKYSASEFRDRWKPLWSLHDCFNSRCDGNMNNQYEIDISKSDDMQISFVCNY